MSDADDEKLRSRVQQGLMSPLTNLVIFQMDNVKVQYLQYHYLSQLIGRNRVKVEASGWFFNSGRRFRPDDNTLQFEVDAPWNAIMHEATHAVIWACNPGLDVARGTQEASAYLAETMFNIAWLQGPPDLDYPNLAAPVRKLAYKMLESSTAGKMGVCDGDSVAEIKGILSKTVAVNSVDKQAGIAY